jgi:hypothetical protein
MPKLRIGHLNSLRLAGRARRDLRCGRQLLQHYRARLRAELLAFNLAGEIVLVDFVRGALVDRKDTEGPGRVGVLAV